MSPRDAVLARPIRALRARGMGTGPILGSGHFSKRGRDLPPIHHPGFGAVEGHTNREGTTHLGAVASDKWRRCLPGTSHIVARVGLRAALMTALLALSACRGASTSPRSGAGSRPSADHSASRMASRPSSRETTAGGVGCSGPSKAQLTGYGASKDAWLSTHQQAAGYTKGAAFLPMVRRGNETLPKYAAVQLETPVVVPVAHRTVTLKSVKVAAGAECGRLVAPARQHPA